MMPILSATGTYNCFLARWLEEKLKPLSLNRFTIKNTFDFSDKIREMDMSIFWYRTMWSLYSQMFP